MGEVPAHRQCEAHDLIAWLEESEIDGEVGRRARVGLHVGVLGAKQGTGTFDGQRFQRVDDLLAFVVTLLRVALAVFVGKHRPRGF